MSNFSKEEIRFLTLLSEKYPNVQSLYNAICSINATLILPKGTEHFMSDIHGELEAFIHILNNCSGVIKEKANSLFKGEFSQEEIDEFCAIIYYPEQKLALLEADKTVSKDFYSDLIFKLTELTKFMSVKYTRNEIRSAIPEEYYFIIDELLNTELYEHKNQRDYHHAITKTAIEMDAQVELIKAFCLLIKRLAVRKLYVLGDIYDRGSSPDDIMDLLMEHHAVYFTWGNHDALWMGAACLNLACIAASVRNTLNYGHMHLLESGYGISMRPLYALAQKLYPNLSQDEAALKTITIIMFKLEGQLIKRHPEYKLDERLKLHLIDTKKRTVSYDGNTWSLIHQQFPTLIGEDFYALTDEELYIMEALKDDFKRSERLHRHIQFLYKRGAVYMVQNGNLLLHGCVPLTPEGELLEVSFEGEKYSGQHFLDFCDVKARTAYRTKAELDGDFMWFLWCGDFSPLCGRKMATFAHLMIADRAAFTEPRDPYYTYNKTVEGCEMLLESFNLDPKEGHIINGHTPVLKGESPVRADGRILVIDGGFCKAYHKRTGIAGYTLISNSHGLRIVAHNPFTGVENVVKNNTDISSTQEEFIPYKVRQTVKDTNDGIKLNEKLNDLYRLLEAYRLGIINPTNV
ncbi:MAG: fructose-bisphosphatase class III [Christensenellales bacterium]|nr:fructose-1,6-bisphosphatase [Christensenellaceae bacterium]